MASLKSFIVFNGIILALILTLIAFFLLIGIQFETAITLSFIGTIMIELTYIFAKEYTKK